MNRKKCISFLLVFVLAFGSIIGNSALTAQAKKSTSDKISEAKKEQEALEKEQKALKKKKKELAAKLETLATEMAETEEKITSKEDEIEEAEGQLADAQCDEDDQYESMKKRIQYMYETNDSDYVELLFSSQSISDLINKAEYISTLEDYDRDMLEKFQQIRMEIEEKEEALEKEFEELQTLKDDLTTKQDEVTQLLKDNELELEDVKSEISDNAEQLQELLKQAEIERQKAEEAKKAAEAAKAAASTTTGNSSSEAGASVSSGSGTFTHPCPGARITSSFGKRSAPTAGASTYHQGLDMAIAAGSPVYAAAAGKVVSTGYNSVEGNNITVNHGNGLVTKYKHLSKIYVSSGQTVTRGQNIGAVGSTGVSTGAHLHFEVRVNGTAVNPLNYL
jgi:murein DD-endopeptidase MepM/ murein hydrolase activator NlpD